MRIKKYKLCLSFFFFFLLFENIIFSEDKFIVVKSELIVQEKKTGQLYKLIQSKSGNIDIKKIDDLNFSKKNIQFDTFTNIKNFFSDFKDFIIIKLDILDQSFENYKKETTNNFNGIYDSIVLIMRILGVMTLLIAAGFTSNLIKSVYPFMNSTYVFYPILITLCLIWYILFKAWMTIAIVIAIVITPHLIALAFNKFILKNGMYHQID